MLIIPIKKKWFKMIDSGEKREEYRDVKPYWIERLNRVFGGDLQTAAVYGRKRVVAFRNGYGKDRPTIEALVSLRFGTGRPSWGAVRNREYIVLKIWAKKRVS